MEIFEQKLIAKGGTADIYDLGNGTIFKCFHDDKNDYCIESEIQCTSSKVAIALGAPQILERVNDERGRGFIMENIRGQTMLEKMFVQGADFDIKENAQIMAQLQYKISEFEGKDFPSGHDVMKERILQSSFLDDAEKNYVLKILDSLPQGTSVCHSDLHPANIIITESEEYRVIDWCDTMCDSPLLDVARTLLIYKSVAPMPGTNLEDLNKSRGTWYYFYKSAWENLAGTSENELNKWLAVLAAVKLAESDSADHQWMKELMRN